MLKCDRVCVGGGGGKDAAAGEGHAKFTESFGPRKKPRTKINQISVNQSVPACQPL